MKDLFKKTFDNINCKSTLYYFTLAFFMAIFLFSCYMIGNQLLASVRSEKEYHSIQATYYNNIENLDQVQNQNEEGLLQGEVEQMEKKISPRFHSLLEQNDDTIGWIRISNTGIDYPIVQGQDNDYYLNRTFEKDKNKAGAIFMDFRNNIESLDQNTIIYGHHMKDGSMFTELKKFRNEDFVSENPMIIFDTLYEEMEWEIFAVYITDTSFNYIQPKFSTESEFQDFIKTIKSKSVIPVESEITQEDHILTLSTCGYDFDDARIVVQARLLEN